MSKPAQTPATRNKAARSLVDETATKVELLDTYSDDHILCASVRVDGVDIDLPWCGEEISAAVRYWHNSPRAQHTLAEYVLVCLSDAGDDDDPFGPTNGDEEESNDE